MSDRAAVVVITVSLLVAAGLFIFRAARLRMHR